jgi:HAD superfamily hydrolase (TIGR01509 family)
MTEKGTRPTALIFDVEGTLIDCVPQTLACWHRTLRAFGYAFTEAQLQAYSGLDGRDKLNRLLPDAPSQQEKTKILKEQGRRYRAECIETVAAFEGVHPLFDALRSQGYRLALATTCQKDELDCYDRLLQVRELCDVVVCGSDVKKGKPHSDLFRFVLNKLSLHQHSAAVAIGDTPFDAMAARASGMGAIGVLTGGYAAQDLEHAGCAMVLPQIADLPTTTSRPRIS